MGDFADRAQENRAEQASLTMPDTARLQPSQSDWQNFSSSKGGSKTLEDQGVLPHVELSDSSHAADNHAKPPEPTEVQQLPDGTTVSKYENGTVQTDYPDGKFKVNFPDGSVRTGGPNDPTLDTNPDGSSFSLNRDGSRSIVNADGSSYYYAPDSTDPVQTGASNPDFVLPVAAGRPS